MVLAIVELDADRAADERRAQFGDEFLAGIVLALRGNEGRTGEPVDMACCVAKLVRGGLIIGVAGVEIGKDRHDDVIAARLVIGL